VNIYRMNDYDWVAAESGEAATRLYRQIMPEYGMEEEDVPEKLTDSEMERLIFHCEDGTRLTFRENLEKIMAEPGRSHEPFFFASTEY
jgi:hypothetical protein